MRLLARERGRTGLCAPCPQQARGTLQKTHSVCPRSRESVRARLLPRWGFIVTPTPTPAVPWLSRVDTASRERLSPTNAHTPSQWEPAWALPLSFRSCTVRGCPLCALRSFSASCLWLVTARFTGTRAPCRRAARPSRVEGGRDGPSRENRCDPSLAQACVMRGSAMCVPCV